MQQNKAQHRHLPGDTGTPFCAACREKLKFQVERDGTTSQRCACGTFPLATVRIGELPPKQPDPVKRYCECGRELPKRQRLYCHFCKAERLVAAQMRRMHRYRERHHSQIREHERQRYFAQQGRPVPPVRKYERSSLSR